jgi:hypothetical protein
MHLNIPAIKSPLSWGIFSALNKGFKVEFIYFGLISLE